MKVMVVDDEADVRMLFEQRFRKEVRAGLIEFYFALSGQEALDFLETHEEDLLILSDINMPGMNGLDLLARIKTDRPDLPVVMITAYGDPETRRRAKELGAHGLLTKPVDFAALREEIDRRLSDMGSRA